MRRSGEGFAAIEIIAGLGLLMVVVLLLQSMEVIRALQDERSSRIMERERALGALLPRWMEGEDTVLVIIRGADGWTPIYFPDRSWLPEFKVASLTGQGAFVFSRERIQIAGWEGWSLQYRDPSGWMPWGRFLVPDGPPVPLEATPP